MNLSRHLPRFLRTAIVKDLTRQLNEARRTTGNLANSYHAAALEADLAFVDVKRLQGALNVSRELVELLDAKLAEADNDHDAMQDCIAELEAWVRRAVSKLTVHVATIGEQWVIALLDSSPLTDTPSPAEASHGGSEDEAGDGAG